LIAARRAVRVNTIAGDKPGAEALSGLAPAFFYAGACALLVSHWAVESNTAMRQHSTFSSPTPRLGVALDPAEGAGEMADEAHVHGDVINRRGSSFLPSA
jgi:hypothetical protein